MKAIVVRQFGGPEVLKLENIPTPTAGEGQVLVRIKAAGVNPADTYIRSGSYAKKPDLPYTPGVDGAGIVEAVGPGVTRVKAGDRVYLAQSLSGTYAEYALALERQVHPLPERLSFGQGAGVNVPYATAYHALVTLAHARGGDTILVHGASGGVGIAAVQMARAAGLQVFGTVGTDRGRELARHEGAHVVLDHGSTGYQEEALRLTGGRGFDVILEMLANKNLGADLTLLAQHGRIVIIGSRGETTFNPRELMGKEGAIFGMILWNVPPHEEEHIHAALLAGLENGTLRPKVGKEIPLSDAAKAHQAVMEPGAFGKIVLIP